jgi:6-pyruvoyltetrahydropterin/6-carboxytetrahydropterin synthase
MAEVVSITRRYSLPALHTLAGPGFSPAKNEQVFGACSRLHGHEYLVDVTLGGAVDGTTGLLFSRDKLDEIVDLKIIQPFRGANLSDHFAHTTGEALALEFYRILEKGFPPTVQLRAVTVHETAKNSFIAGADST